MRYLTFKSFFDPRWEQWHQEISRILVPRDIALCAIRLQNYPGILNCWRISNLIAKSLVSLLLGNTKLPLNTLLVAWKWHVRSDKATKKIIALSYYQLIQFKFSINDPNIKRWGTRTLSVIKYLTDKLYYIAVPSLTLSILDRTDIPGDNLSIS